METDYTNIADKALYTIVQDPHNISFLERSLRRELDRRNTIQNYINRNLGDILSSVDAIFSEVTHEVHGYLGINNVKPCKIKNHTVLTNRLTAIAFSGLAGLVVDGSCAYLGLTETIYLHPLPRVKLIGDLAHEYTHHVQKQLIPSKPIRSAWCFREGQARSVERRIAQIYSAKEKNPVFWQSINGDTIRELSIAYSWTCNKNGVQPKISSKEMGIINGLNMDLEKNYKPHIMGNAAVSILEEMGVKDLHRSALQGVLRLE